MNLRDNHRLENRTFIIKGEYNLAVGKQRPQHFEAKKKTPRIKFQPYHFCYSYYSLYVLLVGAF